MSVLSIPNTFVTGTTIQAAPFNANFEAILVAVNSIDNTNIGTAGIYASQIIPATSAQATFGGAQAYTFPAGISATTGTFSAPIQASSNTSTKAYVPPVYTAAGASTASTLHVVTGTVTANSSVTLSGAAAFTSASSYVVIAAFDTGTTSPGVLYVNYVSGTQFTIDATAGGGTALTHWIAIGT